MQDGQKSGEGPLSSDELDQDRSASGTTIRQGDAPGHTLPKSESDPSETSSDSASSGTIPGIVPPPD